MIARGTSRWEIAAHRFETRRQSKIFTDKLGINSSVFLGSEKLTVDRAWRKGRHSRIEVVDLSERVEKMTAKNKSSEIYSNGYKALSSNFLILPSADIAPIFRDKFSRFMSAKSSLPLTLIYAPRCL